MVGERASLYMALLGREREERDMEGLIKHKKIRFRELCHGPWNRVVMGTCQSFTFYTDTIS